MAQQVCMMGGNRKKAWFLTKSTLMEDSCWIDKNNAMMSNQLQSYFFQIKDPPPLKKKITKAMFLKKQAPTLSLTVYFYGLALNNGLAL